MTDSITPPPELVQQWRMDAWQARIETMGADVPAILLEIAQYGADQELEACAKWVGCMFHGHKTWSDELRAARRPATKPPETIEVDGFTYRLIE